jgi:hypothetical protein
MGRRLHTFPAPSISHSFSSFLFMPSFFRASFIFLSFLLFGLVSASRINNRGRLPGLLQPLSRHAHTPRKISRRSCRPSLPAMTASCFPAYGFQMPSQVPNSMDGWWCNPADEYAFLGFSYEITLCELLTFHISPGAPWFMHLSLFQVRVYPSYKRILRTSEIPSTVVTFAFTGSVTMLASSRTSIRCMSHKHD